MLINMPPVNTFENLLANKYQAAKVLEEAAEMYSAFNNLFDTTFLIDKQIKNEELSEEEASKIFNIWAGKFVEESCDVIQSVINTVYAVLGEDTEENIVNAMKFVEEKNRERGYYDNEQQSEG